jgi:hypothetical protein
MILCNGGCSGKRAALEKRTQAGKTDPSAPREMDWCAASVSTAATWTPPLSKRSTRFASTTRSGERGYKTWTFLEQTKPAQRAKQSRLFLRN